MKVAVLGGYQTKFGELWQQSLEDLMAEAAVAAIKDSGIDKEQLQVAYIGNKLANETNQQNHLGAVLTSVMDLNIPVVRVEAACASGGVAVHQACLAISSGVYDLALVVGVEKMTDLPSELVTEALMTAASEEERLAGLSFVGLYALFARKYCQQFGVPADVLGKVAIKNHFHASLNDKAHFSFEIDQGAVARSPLIADPLRLLDCSPVSDGAAALVLASENLARKLTRRPVWITGSAQANDTISLSERASLTSLSATKQAKQRAYKMAAIESDDVDFLEAHDCFTIAELLALEDLGFYAPGESWAAMGNGEVRLGGKRPVNLSGGLKACGHPVGATGVKQVVEVFNQLKQRAGRRQVESARLGLTHNVGGSGGSSVVHILQI